jgi:TonB family protein
MNRMEVARALQRAYPASLRTQGIGGTARVVILVTEGGTVEAVEVSESSGEPQFDAAAKDVAMRMQFTGLRYENAPICYVTSFPVSFMMR